MRGHVVGLIVGICVAVAVLTAAPAGAATVAGALQVTDLQPTSVTFTVTGQRTCAAGEQCDYYADLEELTGGGDCPASYPADPWNAWNGQVQNTGPTTETGTITPRTWLSRGAVGPERLCLFLFADNMYYYVGGVIIYRPDPSTGTAGSATPTQPPAPGSLSTPTQPITAPTAPTAPVGGSSTGRTPARPTAARTLTLTQATTAARAALKQRYGRRFTQRRRYRATCRRRSRTQIRCAISWQHGGTWRGTVDVTATARSGRTALATHTKIQQPQR